MQKHGRRRKRGLCTFGSMKLSCVPSPQYVLIVTNSLVVVLREHHGTVTELGNGGQGAYVASKQWELRRMNGLTPTHSPHGFHFSHGSRGDEKLRFGSPRRPYLATSHDLLSSVH